MWYDVLISTADRRLLNGSLQGPHYDALNTRDVFLEVGGTPVAIVVTSIPVGAMTEFTIVSELPRSWTSDLSGD